MLYDLRNEYDRERFQARVGHLLDRETVVELSERKSRTTDQNAYLHAILSEFAMQTGNRLDYVKTTYYKKAANRDLYVTVIKDDLAGWTEVVRSSRDLTVEEMSLSIDRFRNWSSEVAGIYLPSSDETEAIAQIKRNAALCAKYL